jgi:hypothetical protein
VIELEPEQPDDVARTIEALTAPAVPEPDSWWREGNEEALYGEATARPRNTLGADLA